MGVAHICDEVQQRAADWRKIRLFLCGARAVKDAGTLLLPRLPGQSTYGVGNQTVDEYQNYKFRAKPLTAYVKRVLRGLVGMCFRRDPVFTVPDEIVADLDNLTLTGTTATGFAKRLLAENLAMSFGAIVVDYSEAAQRPYQRFYAAENILDWEHAIVGGVPVPRRIVLREYQTDRDAKGMMKRVECRREIALAEGEQAGAARYPLGITTHQLYRQQDERGAPTTEWLPYGPPIVPRRRQQPIDFLPVVLFNADGIEWEPSDPVLLELIELVHAHYLLSADLGQLLHLVGAGTFLHGAGISDAEKREGVKVGGGGLVLSTSDAATYRYVQTSGSDAAVITAEMEAIKHECAVAVARLLLSEERRVAETAESQRVAFAADDATLQNIVGSTGFALERAMRMHAWWQSTAPTTNDVDVSVTLNTDFIEARMSADELVRIGIEVAGGRLSWSSYFALAKQGELVPADRTEEDERRLIAESGQGDASMMAEAQASLAAMRAAMASGDQAAMANAMASLDALLSTVAPAE